MGLGRTQISFAALPCIIQVRVAAQKGDLAMAQTHKVIHGIDKGLLVVDIKPRIVITLFGAALHDKGNIGFAQVIDARILALGAGDNEPANFARSDQTVHDFDFVVTIGDGRHQQIPIRQGQFGGQAIKDFGQKRINLMPIAGGQDKADGFDDTARQTPGRGRGAIAQFIGGLAHAVDGFCGNVGIVVERARNRSFGQAKMLGQSGNRHGFTASWRPWHLAPNDCFYRFCCDLAVPETAFGKGGNANRKRFRLSNV